MHIVWKSQHRSQHVPQLAVNMFFEGCSHSHKPIWICPPRGNVLTWAAGGLKEGIVLNDIGTPWGGRQTVRGSEQVICSALLHVKWDTFTLSYRFSPPLPPLNLLFCSLLKGNFTKEVSRELQEGFVEGLVLLLLLHILTSVLFGPLTPLFSSSSTLSSLS